MTGGRRRGGFAIAMSERKKDGTLVVSITGGDGMHSMRYDTVSQICSHVMPNGDEMRSIDVPPTWSMATMERHALEHVATCALVQHMHVRKQA